MNRPRNRMNSSFDEEDFWDGNDRRNDERRYHQIQVPYYQYPQYPPQQPQPLQQPPIVTADANVAHQTLTLQQLGAIIVVLGSVLLSGFTAWNNLNKELDVQKNTFDQFKTQISRDVDDVQSSMKELRKLNEDMRSQDQKTAEALDRRIQDLDTSLTQIYQKVSKQ